MNKSIFLLLVIIILTSGCVYSNNTTDVEFPVTDYVYTPIVNNTDLAPGMGTGERDGGILYWANTSPLDVYIFTHNPTPADIDIDIFINNTRIQDDDVHTTVSNQNRSKWFHVPYVANYTVNLNESGGLHHYEWREFIYSWVKVR